MKFAGYFVYRYAATLYVAIVVPTSYLSSSENCHSESAVVVYEAAILCIFESNTSFLNTKTLFRFEIIVITGNGLPLKYIYFEQLLKRY